MREVAESFASTITLRGMAGADAGRDPQVQAIHKSLYDSARGLSDRVNLLISRIEPCLRPDSPTVPQGGEVRLADTGALCQLASGLHDIRNMIDSTSAAVQDALERVEV